MRVAATEVVAMAPDVIFVTTNPVVSALKEVTRTIPIVFTWVSDSVGSGYVTNFAHPGGNITGFHNYEPVLGAKWMGILKEIAPAVRRVAFVHVPEITANVAFMRVGPVCDKYHNCRKIFDGGSGSDEQMFGAE